MKTIIITISLLFLSGCATVNTNSITVRQGALPASESVQNKVSVDNVSSQSSSVAPENLRLALEESLRGQQILSNNLDNAEYKLSVDYISSTPPTWGLKTKVSVNMFYNLINANSGDSIYEKELTSSCISALSLGDAIAGTIALSEKHHVLDNKVDLSDSTDNQDAVLGYPKDGVKMSSVTASTRGAYAKECAIRKNIVNFIQDLNSL